MRQSEFKKRYDPDLDMYVMRHVEGEGIGSMLKSVGKKIFGKTGKKLAKKAASSTAKTAATKTGEYAGMKAGEKIVGLLSKDRTTTQPVQMAPNIFSQQAPTTSLTTPKELTREEILQRLNSMAGGKLRKKRFIKSYNI